MTLTNRKQRTVRPVVAFLIMGCMLVAGMVSGVPLADASELGSPALVVSDVADRSGASPLDGTTLAGSVYVGLDATSQNAIRRVDFSLDGDWVSTERRWPFDLRGGTRAAAKPLDTMNMPDGQHTVTARVQYGDRTTVVEATFTVANEASNATVLYRVNAGGPALPAAPGDTGPDWAADDSDTAQAAGWRTTGSRTASSSSPLQAADDSVPAYVPADLFERERWDPSADPQMVWSFPVDQGTYEVRIYLADTYSGTQGRGLRIFDVIAEGAVALDNFDVYAEAGAATPTMRSIRVAVDDGALDLAFGHVTENPSVRGVEILAGSDGIDGPPTPPGSSPQPEPAQPTKPTGPYAGYRRGVAVAGGSFNDGATSSGPMTTDNPGRYGTDWFYDVDGANRSNDAGLTYLRDRGIDLIRVDFRWERLQPTLYGQLNPAEVNRISAMLDAAAGNDLDVVLDMHNYGHYKAGGAPNLSSAQGGWSLGQPQLPYGAFADVWQRIVRQWGAHPAVWGWELMNEPVNMASTSGGSAFAPGRTVFSFDDGEQSHFHTGPGSKRMDVTGSSWRSLGTGGTRDHAEYGDTIGAWVRVEPGSAPTAVSLQLQDASWKVHGGPQTDVPDDGEWHHVTWSPPAGLLADHQEFAIYVSGGAGSKTVWVDDVTVGNSPDDGRSGVQHWQAASQAAVEAIRTAEAPGSARAVLVAGYNWSQVQRWDSINGDPWIRDPLSDPDRLVYVGHHYWDAGSDSSYGEDTPSSVSGSPEAHALKVVGELRNFTSWLDTHGVRGAITEVGWPDNAGRAEWNTVAQRWFDEADSARLHVTAWATGAAWGDYELAMYEANPGRWSWHAGDTIDNRNHQASVLEAHLSTP